MSENNKLKLLYILEIMKKTDEFHPLNATQICRKLEVYGISAERKSISRDIQCLDDAGYSIQKCTNHNQGYYMTDQVFEDYELKFLADSVSVAKFLTEKDSRELIGKIVTLATKEGEELITATTNMDISLKSDDRANKLKFDGIIKAIKARKKISFQYFEIGKNNQKYLKREGYVYKVSPYFVTLYQDEYFLIANPEKHNHATHFRLEMMTNIIVLDQPVRPILEIEEFALQGRHFKISEYLRQNINMWTGNVVAITLICKNCIRHDIFMKFGKGVWIMDADDGTFKVNVKVTDNEGLYQWLAQYGTNVKVLKPLEVRGKYLNYISNISEMYKYDE